MGSFNLQRRSTALRALDSRRPSMWSSQLNQVRRQASLNLRTSTRSCSSYGRHNTIVKSGSGAAGAPAQLDCSFEDLLRYIETKKRLCVLTGAGVSTESNIPDYRGPQGAYKRGYKPVMHLDFVRSEKTRQRYWGRSMRGWREFANCQPNRAHFALADLEAMGIVSGIITQNVDRLHQRAGSKRVLELHGTTHEVTCLTCGNRTPRDQVQALLEKLNPTESFPSNSNGRTPLYTTPRGTPGLARPDGDVEVTVDEGFVIPPCSLCGPDRGMLKPSVTFFGDNVEKQLVEEANEMVKESDGFLVVGSSLMVFSAFRLAKLASDLGMEIGVLNMGETRADGFENLIKHQAPIGETMGKVRSCILV